VSDALRRAARTFIQSFLGSLLTTGVLSGAATSGIVDWSGLEKTGVAAMAAGIVALISFAQNALEDHDVLPPLLKQPSS